MLLKFLTIESTPIIILSKEPQFNLMVITFFIDLKAFRCVSGDKERLATSLLHQTQISLHLLGITFFVDFIFSYSFYIHIFKSPILYSEYCYS